MGLIKKAWAMVFGEKPNYRDIEIDSRFRAIDTRISTVNERVCAVDKDRSEDSNLFMELYKDLDKAVMEKNTSVWKKIVEMDEEFSVELKSANSAISKNNDFIGAVAEKMVGVCDRIDRMVIDSEEVEIDIKNTLSQFHKDMTLLSGSISAVSRAHDVICKRLKKLETTATAIVVTQPGSANPPADKPATAPVKKLPHRLQTKKKEG